MEDLLMRMRAYLAALVLYVLLGLLELVVGGILGEGNLEGSVRRAGHSS